MFVLLAAALVAAAIVWASQRSGSVTSAPLAPPAPDASVTLLTLFAEAAAAVERDPQALLVWAPVARAARSLHPDVCARIDAGSSAAVRSGAD